MYRKGAQSHMSYKIYEEVIKKISNEQELWKYDVDDYIDENKCENIIEFKEEIRSCLIECFNKNDEKGAVSDLLATKIMLGTFGCVPAIDTYFRRFIGHATLNHNSLSDIHSCYLAHKELIDTFLIKTLNEDYCETPHKYKKARLIDYAGFCIGKKL